MTATVPTVAECVALWERAMGGDRPARDELVLAARPSVAWHANRMARKYAHPEPDDLIADAMLKVIKAVPSYKPAGGGWVNYAVCVATREMKEKCDRRAARPEVAADPDHDPAGRAAGGTAELVAAAVAGLPPLERAAVHLRGGYPGPKLPPAEAARRLGVSRVRLARLLGRGTKRLRSRLAAATVFP